VDVVLLDVMMPGMDGFETCRRIKSNPSTAHVPVIMVTALDQPSDRIQGLEAGADDFLSKPVDDIALMTRVKNLARLKTLNDEMLMRAATGRQLGVGVDRALETALADRGGKVLVVEDHARMAQRLVEALRGAHEADIEADLATALTRLCDGDYDAAIVSLGLASADGLRLCSQIRSFDRIRHLPIIVLAEPGEQARLMRALDMGVNDYLMRPVDRHEMLARVKTQIKRKRHSDYLRSRLEESVEMAVTDALTGLHNRRYMETHLKGLVEECQRSGRALSLLVADIDFFKRINDGYGHDAGDAVLREFAARFRRNTRGADLACRIGGEEFIIVMPDTEIGRAYQVGERLRATIASEGFTLADGKRIRVTASVGIATLESEADTPETLFKRADSALYAAKRRGRNRVVSEAA